MFHRAIYSQNMMKYHLRHVRQMGGVSWKGPIDTAWIVNKIKLNFGGRQIFDNRHPRHAAIADQRQHCMHGGPSSPMGL